MKFRSSQKKIERTPEDIARIKALREQFQREKPGLADCDGPFNTHGVMLTRMLLLDFKRAREAAGLTLADVAERTGIDQPALSRLENGRNANPTVDTLHRLAAALGKEIIWELGAADDAIPGVSRKARANGTEKRGKKAKK